MRQRKPNRKLVVALVRLRSPVTMPHPSAAIARHGRSPISRRMQNGRYGAIDRQRVTFVELGTPKTLRTYLGLPSSSAEHSRVPNPRRTNGSSGALY